MALRGAWRQNERREAVEKAWNAGAEPGGRIEPPASALQCPSEIRLHVYPLHLSVILTEAIWKQKLDEAVFSLSSNIFESQMVFLGGRKTSDNEDDDHVRDTVSYVVQRDEGGCRQRERRRSVQFCCSMRFSSSSADRSRKAADSRYPAISWRTAATSVWLSWAEAPPPPPFLPRLLELDEDEFDARDFILRSVGPERRE